MTSVTAARRCSFRLIGLLDRFLLGVVGRRGLVRIDRVVLQQTSMASG